MLQFLDRWRAHNKSRSGRIRGSLLSGSKKSPGNTLEEQKKNKVIPRNTLENKCPRTPNTNMGKPRTTQLTEKNEKQNAVVTMALIFQENGKPVAGIPGEGRSGEFWESPADQWRGSGRVSGIPLKCWRVLGEESWGGRGSPVGSLGSHEGSPGGFPECPTEYKIPGHATSDICCHFSFLISWEASLWPKLVFPKVVFSNLWKANSVLCC